MYKLDYKVELLKVTFIQGETPEFTQNHVYYCKAPF
jgi:hypothetical protein